MKTAVAEIDPSWPEEREAADQELRQQVQNRLQPRLITKSEGAATAPGSDRTEVVENPQEEEQAISEVQQQDPDVQQESKDLGFDITKLLTLNDVLREEVPELLNNAQQNANVDENLQTTTRHSTRTRRRNPRYYNDQYETSFSDEECSMHVNNCMTLSMEEKHSFYQAMTNLEGQNLDEHSLLTEPNPLVYASKLKNDTPRFQQAMNGPSTDKFYDAMEAEMLTLEAIDPWEIVPRDSVGDQTFLDTTWARWKRAKA